MGTFRSYTRKHCITRKQLREILVPDLPLRLPKLTEIHNGTSRPQTPQIVAGYIWMCAMHCIILQGKRQEKEVLHNVSMTPCHHFQVNRE